jgi:hypothetical protein
LIEQHRPLIVFEHRYGNLPANQWQAVLQVLENYGYQLYLPSWRSEQRNDVDNPAILRHPTLVSEGLQLYGCTSRTRFDYPEFPDLLACPRDRLSLLSNIAQLQLRRAA